MQNVYKQRAFNAFLWLRINQTKAGSSACLEHKLFKRSSTQQSKNTQNDAAEAPGHSVTHNTRTCPAKIPHTPMMQRMLKTAEPTMVPTPTSPWVMNTPARREEPIRVSGDTDHLGTSECKRVCACVCMHQWRMRKALVRSCQLPWRWLLRRPRSDPVSAETKAEISGFAQSTLPGCSAEQNTPTHLTDLLQRRHKVFITSYGERQKHIQRLRTETSQLGFKRYPQQKGGNTSVRVSLCKTYSFFSSLQLI